MNEHYDKGNRAAGLAAMGGLVTGLAGWIVAGCALLDDGNWVNASMALAVSALAFGLIANAIFRR